MATGKPTNNRCETYSNWLSFLADVSIDRQIDCPNHFDSSSINHWVTELRLGLDSAIENSSGDLESCLKHLQGCRECQQDLVAYQNQNEFLGSMFAEPEEDFLFDPTSSNELITSASSDHLVEDCLDQFYGEKVRKEEPSVQTAAPVNTTPRSQQNEQPCNLLPNASLPSTTKDEIGKRSDSNWFGWAAAIAAFVLLAIAISPWETSPNVEPNPVASIDIQDKQASDPGIEITHQLLSKVSDLHQLNRSNWVDQQLAVVGLEMELRTLREKMVSLNADPEAKKKIITNIDRLLDSVRSVRTPALTSPVVQANPAVHITPPDNQ